ncbi:lytic murein transglycosylase [Methylopila sp. M107]|uniref:lytic murein transglycosylase n=1 Tax=Methylopila sp. M107 TaxID=1101190 RepID=UPI0003827138|nr:lytic murein transglycosylase [Methylopila sp. M107]
MPPATRSTFARLAATFCLAASAVLAGAPAANAEPQLDAFIRSFKPTALKAGVSSATYDRAFRNVSYDSEAIEKFGRQLEFKLSIANYVDTQVSDTRISRGQDALKQYGPVLNRIERQYGVDKYSVLAVWGMETNYGATMGGHNVIAAISTLACCAHRRNDFYRKELLAALKILEAGHVTPENMIGSWAGAMGQTQFMPTNFNPYAADGDGDGKRDIWNSVPDALASTANFLRKHGWQPGQSWGREAPGGNFKPAGPNGPTFATTANYRVIKRYNNADSYALAVAHLSDRIKGAGPFVTPWPNHSPPLDEAGRFELQTHLARLGYDVGEPDGKIGPATRQAITDWQKKQGLSPDGYASVSLLRKMKTSR